MPEAFAAKSAALVEQLRIARARRDPAAEHRALAALLALYEQLGNREIGTPTQQNEYIVALHLGHVPRLLQDLGVTPQDLPEPPGRRRAARTPPTGTDTAALAERLAHLRGRDDEDEPERFQVQHRPQDNVVLKGRPQPFAIVDADEHGMPVSWYDSRDAAEEIAGVVNRMRQHPH